MEEPPDDHSHPGRPRRRLRGPVRPADRPPGPGAPTSTPRSCPTPSARPSVEARARPRGHHPLGRAQERCTSRVRRASTPTSTTWACPVLGICYGAQLIAHQLGGRTVGRNETGRVRPHHPDPHPDHSGVTAPRCGHGPAGTQTVWMSHFDAITEVPRRVRRACASTPNCSRRGVRERASAGSTASSTTPRSCHSPGGTEHVLGRFLGDDLCRVHGRRGPWPRSSTPRSTLIQSQVGPRAGHLRAVGRGRFGGGCGPGPPGHRVPADLRLRRHRADAAGRVGSGGRDLPAPSGHRADPRPVRGAVLRAVGRGHRPRGQAQDDRRGLHPGLRRGLRRHRRMPSSWSRAPCTPTSSSRARPTRPRSRATTTWAASPTTSSSNWSSRSATCSRTRSGGSAPSWACPTRSCGVSRSPGRASG